MIVKKPSKQLSKIKKADKPMILKSKEIEKQETLTFDKAILALIDGKRIKRLEWAQINPNDYGMIEQPSGNLKIFGGISQDGKLHEWILNYTDITANDWIVID